MRFVSISLGVITKYSPKAFAMVLDSIPLGPFMVNYFCFVWCTRNSFMESCSVCIDSCGVVSTSQVCLLLIVIYRTYERWASRVSLVFVVSQTDTTCDQTVYVSFYTKYELKIPFL